MSINPLISLATYHWVSVLDAAFESHIFLCPSEVYQFSWKELHVSLTYIEPLPDCSVSSTIEASQLSTHCQGPGGLLCGFGIAFGFCGCPVFVSAGVADHSSTSSGLQWQHTWSTSLDNQPPHKTQFISPTGCQAIASWSRWMNITSLVSCFWKLPCVSLKRSWIGHQCLSPLLWVQIHQILTRSLHWHHGHSIVVTENTSLLCTLNLPMSSPKRRWYFNLATRWTQRPPIHLTQKMT